MASYKKYTQQVLTKESHEMSEETMEGEDAVRKLESSKNHVKNAAGDLRAAAEAKAGELRGMAEAKAAEYRGKAEHAYGEARDRARTFREEGEGYIRENPARAVLTALGVGFVIGLAFRP